MLPIGIYAAVADSAGPPSPAELRITAAEKAIQTEPKSWQHYNDLAGAYIRKARDNDDTAMYDRADSAIERSLQLSAGNLEAQKMKCAVMLGRQDFSGALKLAVKLNKLVPDDIGIWGFLVDGNIAVGEYTEAVRDSQWILDLRRDSELGFAKAAVLRELHGDLEGANEFFEEAMRRTGPYENDERAWLWTKLANIQLLSGNPKRASDLLDQALKIYPDSLFATATLAKVRLAQEHQAEAAALFEKRFTAIQTPVHLYDWAQALDRTGDKPRADAAFERFETEARARMAEPGNANLDLIHFLTEDRFDRNQKANATEALALATRESAARHDCATLDAFAWALYRNGKLQEAKTQMDRALAVGVRDPAYLCHAAQIAAALNNVQDAKKFGAASRELSPGFCRVEVPAASSQGSTP